MNRLTRDEAAEFLGCSKSAFYGLEKSGRLNGTFYQIGRKRLYITEKLEQWMLNGGTAGTRHEQDSEVIPFV